MGVAVDVVALESFCLYVSRPVHPFPDFIGSLSVAMTLERGVDRRDFYVNVNPVKKGP